MLFQEYTSLWGLIADEEPLHTPSSDLLPVLYQGTPAMLKYANIFCNPSLETATAPGRLPEQARLVAQAAQLDIKRLLGWVLAWTGLSAAWLLEERKKPDLVLQVARLAAAELAS